MAGFYRVDGQLTCDGVALSAIARETDTPVYVYSRAEVEERFRRLDAAFAAAPHLICYAMKANSNGAILRVLSALGAGADVVSGGELEAAMRAGIPADRIVFSGVGKTDAEIQSAARAGILAFNAESEREIEKIDAVAARLRVTAKVALRVNPDIDARSHPYISTGLKDTKFGVSLARALPIYRQSRRLSSIRMTGVQAHIGSQIAEAEPIEETARELAMLARSLLSEGFPLEMIDLGGGTGIGAAELSPERYAAAVLPHVTGLPLRLLLEPGRAIVGPGGVLVTRVLYVKERGNKTFVVTDAGMNDLIRPALYGAAHPIHAVGPPRNGSMAADVVGPICETSDFFGRDLLLPAVEEGDLLAIGEAGAYGFAMASNYNFRGRPSEVLVESGGFSVVRRRETFEDLIRLERE